MRAKDIAQHPSSAPGAQSGAVHSELKDSLGLSLSTELVVVNVLINVLWIHCHPRRQRRLHWCHHCTAEIKPILAMEASETACSCRRRLLRPHVLVDRLMRRNVLAERLLRRNVLAERGF